MYCDYVLASRGGARQPAHSEPLRPGIYVAAGIDALAKKYDAPSIFWKNPLPCRGGGEVSGCSTHVCSAEFSRWKKNTPLCSGMARWEFCYYNLAHDSATEMHEERLKRLRDAGKNPLAPEHQPPGGWYSRDFWTSVEHFLASDHAEQIGEPPPLIKSEDGIAPFSPREIRARQTGVAFRDIIREETAALELLLKLKSPAEVAGISTRLTVTDPVGRELIGQIGQAVLPTTAPAPVPAPGRISADTLVSTTQRPAISGPPARISAESLQRSYPTPTPRSSPVSSFAPGGGASGAANNASDGSVWLLLAFAALKFFLAR